MALTLESCLAKLGRAQDHLESLQEQLLAWVQGRPYAVATNVDADENTRTFRFILAGVFEAPDALSVTFGDYVHNLRSGLDHIVWALAVNNKGGKEPKNANAVGFPVTDNPAAFYDAPVLRYLTWEQATVIESFQPYHGGDAQRALGNLNLFWNDDKHRLVQPVLARVKRMPVYETRDVASVESEWFEGKKPLELNTEICGVTVVPSGPNPKVDVQNVPIEVAFGKRRRIPEDEVPGLRDAVGEIFVACRGFFT